MIAIRCANGFVLFEVGPSNPVTGRTLICLNDLTNWPLPKTSRQAFVSSLEAAGAHAVSLKGAIQQIVQLDID